MEVNMSIQIKDRRKFSYTRIENSVIDNIEIFDKNDLLCYMVLCRFADNETSECFPSYKTIADKMRVSVKTAINAIKSLESKGIIHIENRKDSKGGDTSNLYTILNFEDKIAKKEENKKASSTAIDEAPNNIKSSTSINNSYNKSIPQKDKKDTKKIKKVSEILQVIKDSCVSIREEHLKECEELFTDINRLKLALEICENNNSNGIKALKLAYKKAYAQNNNSNDNFTNNFSKGAGSGVNNNFAKYGNDLEAILQKSQEGKFKDMEQGISQFNPNFKL
jgi:DNA-binding transcriptional regulator YhcF (GntR family)